MTTSDWLVQWALVWAVLGGMVALDRYKKGQWPWK
jgi:hypothetical protein